MIEITVALVSSAIAILSSVITEFIPAWNDWQYKRVTQVTLSLIFPVLAWTLQCGTNLDLAIVVTCDSMGFLKLAGIGISAVLANAGVYQLAVRPRTKRHKEGYRFKSESACNCE